MPTPTRLLATDLDGTFIGDDDEMRKLYGEVRDQQITLAFSTGRHLRSIEDFYAERQFEGRADACICMVGTDIYLRRGEQYELVEDWHKHIAVGWSKAAVEEFLHDIPEARMQDAQWQSPFKSSYFLEENAAQRLAELKQRLAKADVAAKVVYSADKFLDLLPARSGKGEAVKFLAQLLDIDPANVVTAGDTGNDLDMMRPELGFRGIAVGNAAPELKEFQPEHVYHAERHFAGGIREGLQHFGWI